MKQTIEHIENQIDNYENTIFAIVGFINFYEYDCKHEISAFQGRKLTLQNDKESNVTPDIGIVLPDGYGIIAEVKNSLPQDKNFWHSTFEQLKKYDNDFVDWPSETGKSHDLVLLIHQSFAMAFSNFIKDLKKNSVNNFSNPFSIIEYNRSDQRQTFFFFRLLPDGKLSEKKLYKNLSDGIMVPFSKLFLKFSTVKLYDSEPETPYLMFLIWQFVLSELASKDSNFKNLRKNQKFDIEIEIDRLAVWLQEGYSFNVLDCIDSENQPKVPKNSWVRKACSKFVEWGEAKWNRDKTEITFHYHKKYDNVLEHFITEYCKEGSIGQKTFDF